MKRTLRTLSYHPSYNFDHREPCPCFMLGNRRIAQKYGWHVGQLVEVLELKRGILIRKAAFKEGGEKNGF
jgi:hypothetical protein